MFDKFLKDENGATAIEYGLLAATVAKGVAHIAALQALASNLNSTFSGVSANLGSASKLMLFAPRGGALSRG